MRGATATAAALALAALTSGCATTMAPRHVELGQDCLASISELPPNPVHLQAELGKSGAVGSRDFADLARCVETSEGGKAAAALFRLEDPVMPVNLRVVMSEKGGQVLAAAVTTMDAEFGVLGRTGFDRFVNRGTSNTVDIVLNDPRARYVLVSPDSAEVGKSEKQFATLHTATPVFAGPVMFTLQSGSASESLRAYSDAGFLSVVMTPAGPKPVASPK